MKKRTVCFVVTLFMLCCFALCAAGCNSDAYKTAVKNGDDYTIVCAYDDDSHTLSTAQTVKVTNRSENSFSALKFHIYANQYREGSDGVVPQTYDAIAYPNGKSYGGITIDSAKVDGTSVAFSVEGEDSDILSVPLSEELFPDQSVSVELIYEVSLANIKHRLGYTENAVNLGNFFPVLCRVENGGFSCTPYYCVGDPFVTDVANFDVSLKIADKYVVASTGDLVEATSENGFVTYVYRGEAVRDFAMVASDKFRKLSRTTNGVMVNYFYFADENAENSIATAAGALEYYSEKIGEYPYSQLSVCETDFCYGGMEYPQLAMVTSGSESYIEAIAHEVAHQWFYGVVGNDQIENAWMDEGLAEFVTYLYMDNADICELGKNIMANLRTFTTYVDVLRNFYDHADTAFRALYNYKNDNEYVVMTYLKGSLLFSTLFDAMGETKFYKALKNYYNTAKFTIAAPSQMIGSFEKVGGTEAGTIFTDFIDGKEILGKMEK